jgi:arsenate reductase
MNDVVLWRRLVAEFAGSAFLAAVVIGSGIAAQQLSPGNVGLQLLENAAATAAGLYAIILMFGPGDPETQQFQPVQRQETPTS